MGRAQDRKRAKECRKKLNDDQFNKLMNIANSDFIKLEVDRQMEFLQTNFTDAIIESLKKNGFSNTKIAMVIDDVQSIFLKKVNKVE